METGPPSDTAPPSVPAAWRWIAPPSARSTAGNADMWWGYKAAGKAIGAGGRAGGRLGGSLSTGYQLNAAGRGARRGYLAPGDPSPPPSGPTDYLDYRGVAAWQEAQNLENGQFPLGAFSDIKRGKFRGPIGLPGQVLNRHSVIVGPAGSGKTFSLIIPWIHAALASDWSVVAVDVKGDLRDNFLDFNDAQGQEKVSAALTKWDFLDPRGSRPWEWLTELHDEARTDAAISALLGRPEKSTGDPYFYQRDYRTMRGLLQFARASAPDVRTASDLIRFLEDDIKLDPLVKANPRSPGAQDLEAVLRFPQTEYPKIISGVVTALSGLDTPAVSSVTRAVPSRTSINLEAALDDHHLLVIGAALRGGQVSTTMSSLMLNQLSQRLYERFSGQRRPVLLVIDEAPQIMDRVDIAKLMEVARSAGAGVVAAMQDVAQIKDENDRSSVLSNAAAFAILPGASPKSVEEFSKRLGNRYERTVGMTVNGRGGGWGGGQPSQNYGTDTVPVLREREIMQPPFGDRPAVVHVKTSDLAITGKPLLIDMHRA
jgi:type IV secretory pathway TraG/TraD family ATPase VirD4